MREVFEAIMQSKGHTDFSKRQTGVYSNPSLQTRWVYFQLGWNMRGVEESIKRGRS